MLYDTIDQIRPARNRNTSQDATADTLPEGSVYVASLSTITYSDARITVNPTNAVMTALRYTDDSSQCDFTAEDPASRLPPTNDHVTSSLRYGYATANS